MTGGGAADHLLVRGDARRIALADRSVHAVITSPPYFNLRSYLDSCDPNKSLELGGEGSPDEFVAAMVVVFKEIWRVLRDDGVAFLNLGDSYNSAASNQNGGGAALRGYVRGGNRERGRNTAIFRENGLKPKDLMLIPQRVALALQADGWTLRSQIPWVRRNSMPESVTDRPSSSVEYVFLLAKSPRYYYDPESVRVASSGSTLDRDRYSRISGACAKDFADVGKGQRCVHDHETPSHPAGRNRRNGDWWFESVGMLLNDEGDALGLDVNPHGYDGAHFATFPEKLVEPMVLASTSEAGCCGTCGAPWRREVERSSEQLQETWSGAGRQNGCQAGGGHFGRTGQWSSKSVTTGWRPSCPCPPADPRPAVVLDPFAGSGTTLLTALRLGRSAVGCDLNPDYLAMAGRRVADGLRPLSRLDPPRPRAPLGGQMSFLEGVTPWP